MGCSHHRRRFPLASQSAHLTSGILMIWLPRRVRAGSVRIQLSIGQWGERTRGWFEMNSALKTHHWLTRSWGSNYMFWPQQPEYVWVQYCDWQTIHTLLRIPFLVSIALQVQLSVYLPIILFVCLLFCLSLLFYHSLLFNRILSFVHSFYPSVYLSFCLPICLSFNHCLLFSHSLSFCLSLNRSVCQ